jgi:hypothetical protein
MTEEEGDRWIALAVLHGPSTVKDIDRTSEVIGPGRGTHDPLTKNRNGEWWVYRSGSDERGVILCQPNFETRAEAARHYCKHYGIEP